MFENGAEGDTRSFGQLPTKSPKSRRGDNCPRLYQLRGTYRSTLVPPPSWCHAPCGTSARACPPQSRPRSTVSFQELRLRRRTVPRIDDPPTSRPGQSRAVRITILWSASGRTRPGHETLHQNPIQIRQLSGTERSPITDASRPPPGTARRSSGKPRRRRPRCPLLQRPSFGNSFHPRHPPHHRTADATAGSRCTANLIHTARPPFRGIPLRSSSRHLMLAADLRTEPGILPLFQPALHEISQEPTGRQFRRTQPSLTEYAVQHALRLRRSTLHHAEPKHPTTLRAATLINCQIPAATARATRAATHKYCSNIWVHQEPGDSHHNIEEHKLPNLP